jgi:D-lactate dehydrogenase (cytochrome)
VPISRLAHCIDQTTEWLKNVSFPTTIVGHVGDGNFHVLMLLDPNDPSEWEASERLNHDLVNLAIQSDGTCTGEHGIGLHKLQFMEAEHGRDTLEVMQAIKNALDPSNIFNPGKIIPRLV